MRKRLGVAAATAATLVFGMVGTASAQVGPEYCSTGTGADPIGTGALEPDLTNQTVYGQLDGVGYGQSDFGTNGNNVTYTGSANGEDGAVNTGYGDVNGSVGADGVSGDADGAAPGGVSSAEGTFSDDGGLTFNGGADPVCVGVTVP